MRYADANIFLRYLTRPSTPAQQQMYSDCAALFARVKAGDDIIMTSEVTIAEVMFVLTSPRQYGLTMQDAAARLDPLLSLKGVRMPGKRGIRRALTLLVSHPRLGFEDALVAAKLLHSGMELLSYDTDFDRVVGITRVEP